ncbi:MAG: ribonuclease HII [Bosea sp. (in: a-proteobacteria)]
MPPTFTRETLARSQGLWPVAGIDEVGRGPLAGPVVAAAVVLDPDNIPDGLADSKALKAHQREALFPLVALSALGIGIGSASAAEIDALNIREATFLAMRRAVAALPLRPALLLVDGRDRPELGAPVEAIIKGDASVASIAAASIIAKVIRDRMMARLGLAYPAYGFANHAGYGTPAHLAAIKAHGPCPDHRFSFAPVKGRWQRGSTKNTILAL